LELILINVGIQILFRFTNPHLRCFWNSAVVAMAASDILLDFLGRINEVTKDNGINQIVLWFKDLARKIKAGEDAQEEV